MSKKNLISIEVACQKLDLDRATLLSLISESEIWVIDDGGVPKMRADDLEKLSASSQNELELSPDFHEPTQQDGSLYAESGTSEPVTDQASSEMSEFSSPPERDRIVVLGRRKSGKTVFMTRLYHELWNSKGQFHMKALSGSTHKQFMHLANELKEGRWVAATNQTTYADLEISDGIAKRLMVAVDYPGELFTAAFVDDSNREDALELIKHVDRASAVIILISPDIEINESLDETIDDNFGMQKAIEYIRQSPGGDEIPIAVVVTKGDQYKTKIRDHGGLKSFIKKHYFPLLRVIGRYRPFVVAAVQSNEFNEGDKLTYIPNLELPPINLVDPIKWCWGKISFAEEEAEQIKKRENTRIEHLRILDEYNRKRKRGVIFWAIFWILAFVIGIIITVVTWSILKPAIENSTVPPTNDTNLVSPD